MRSIKVTSSVSEEEKNLLK